jgi:8-oxo-dGTP diphosphatase
MDEDLHVAAARELKEETGVEGVFIEQLYTFGRPDRDPRGRVVSVAYYALVNLADHPAKGSDDASEAKWFPTGDLPPLAFDHQDIMEMAFQRLINKIRYQPIGFNLLPEHFTLTQLQQLYETILNIHTKTIEEPIRLNKRNFRGKILKMGFLRELGRQTAVSHRPAQLYSFDKDMYISLTASGFNFEL